MAKSSWDANNIADQTGRVIVITGATSGIGKETARVLAGKNAKVIIGARSIQKANTAIDDILKEFPEADVTVRELDLSNLDSINVFSSSINKDFSQLDVLINNAGIMMCPYAKTVDGFEMQMGTNHLGHFALTLQLLPLLKNTKGSRIVNVSSMAHRGGNIDFSDFHWVHRKYNTNQAYFDSKLANLLFTYELAQKLESGKDNPIVVAAHPGWTSTDLQRHSSVIGFLNNFFAQGAKMGALPTLMAGFDKDVKPGDYYGPCRFFEMHGNPIKVKSNQRSHDLHAAKELWQQSEELTGIRL